MSTDTKDGGPAFPTHGDETVEVTPGNFQWKSGYGAQGAPGMSLRDWFAGQALAGALSEVEYSRLFMLSEKVAYDRVAEHVYRMADAMLAARNAKGEKP